MSPSINISLKHEEDADYNTDILLLLDIQCEIQETIIEIITGVPFILIVRKTTGHRKVVP